MKRDIVIRLELAKKIAEEAGKLIMGFYQKGGLRVTLKKDKSPVTIADQDAEKLLRSLILRTFADDGILGEEMGETESKSGYRWIIDPIDGTESFIRGVPLFGTLIGLQLVKVSNNCNLGASSEGNTVAPPTIPS